MSAFHRLSSKWKQNANRRLYRRLSASGQVFIYDLEEQKGVRGEFISLSLGGISLYAPLSSPEGRKVKVCFEVPSRFDQPITLNGQILRKERTETREHFLVVTFTQWDEPDYLRLKEAWLNPRQESEFRQFPSRDDRQVSEP